MKCPNCSHEWIPDRDEVLSEYARLGGSATSRAKTKAARANAKLGGWPKGKKRGKRKLDANQLAHSIVAKAAKLARKGMAERPPHPGISSQLRSPNSRIPCALA
jgi:hypothetical protein